jgi:hypothetical protein
MISEVFSTGVVSQTAVVTSAQHLLAQLLFFLLFSQAIVAQWQCTPSPFQKVCLTTLTIHFLIFPSTPLTSGLEKPSTNHSPGSLPALIQLETGAN